MTYQETIDFLYNQLPFFQRQGAAALKPKLDNSIALCAYLGNPQEKIKHIHVAGTNGKGSTSHLLAAILQKHGFKVGLYTSPHLKSFTERIKINGEEIVEQDVIDFTELILPKINELEPSFFEVTVAMAFWYFERMNCDIGVIEVGMGGRLDSTNIISPIVSVITNISLDHQQYLGDTLEKIAFEKAGIIKPNTPIVIGEIQGETIDVFKEVAKLNNAPLKLNLKEIQRQKKVKTYSYQDKNIETVLKTIEVLESDGYEFDEQVIIDAIKNFKQITGLKGRWQTISIEPKIICDTGHNIAGIIEIVKLLEKETYQTLRFVLGMVAEKDVDRVLSILPKQAMYYYCSADNPRSLDAHSLCEKAKQYGLKGEVHSSVNIAIENAQKDSNFNDLIFIGGSTFVVAEIPFL